MADTLHCPYGMRWLKEFLQWLRSSFAGALSTAVDLGTLFFLVSVMGVNPRLASIPALVAGGIANFFGNRHFAFRAQKGSLRRQLIGYGAVELVALLLNGVFYDLALQHVPVARHAYWAVRLVTSHVVFLGWSYPLWRKVFRVRGAPNDSAIA